MQSLTTDNQTDVHVLAFMGTVHALIHMRGVARCVQPRFTAASAATLRTYGELYGDRNEVDDVYLVIGACVGPGVVG